MTSTIAPQPARTGVAIGALAAIPVVSVSAVALLGDVASHTDPARLWLGAIASVAGIVTGLLVVRLVRAVGLVVESLSAALVRWFGPAPTASFVASVGLLPRRRALALATVSMPSALRRRGPPAVLR